MASASPYTPIAIGDRVRANRLMRLADYDDRDVAHPVAELRELADESGAAFDTLARVGDTWWSTAWLDRRAP